MLFKLSLLFNTAFAFIPGVPPQKFTNHAAIKPEINLRALSERMKAQLPYPKFTSEKFPRQLHDTNGTSLDGVYTTQNCLSTAKTHRLDPAGFNLYRVTYQDCPDAPFHFCVHDTAKEVNDTNFMFSTFGKMPPGLRSYASDIVALDKPSKSFPKKNNQTALAYANPTGRYAVIMSNHWETGLLAEQLTNNMDRAFAKTPNRYFSQSQEWLDAVAKDQSIPTKSAYINPEEDFGDIGRFALYDLAFKEGNWTQIQNQLALFEKKFGNVIKSTTSKPLVSQVMFVGKTLKEVDEKERKEKASAANVSVPGLALLATAMAAALL